MLFLYLRHIDRDKCRDARPKKSVIQLKQDASFSHMFEHSYE